MNLKGGAAMDMFARELDRVLENINDPNTEPDAGREIVLKVKFIPSKERDTAVVKLSSSTKLAGVRAQATTIHMGRNQGRMVAAEFDPRQMTITEAMGEPASVTPIDGGKKR